jgi:ribosomal protein S18 acetylase RimI-like enzyme
VIHAIDPADPVVAEELLDIQHRAYAVEAELIGFDGIPPLREALAGLMASTEYWLGRYAGTRLVGAVAYELPDAETLDISRLVVDPRVARQGHGRALLDYLDALVPRPVTTVSTGSANTPAVRLYLSRGFREVDQLEVAPGVKITRFRRG